jgi:thiol:disulfide interchange protein
MKVVPSSSLRRIGFVSGFALLGLCSACLVFGCKGKQSEPSAPVAAIPAKPPARQPVTPVPAVKKHLYSVHPDAKADVAEALTHARRQHKRVILDFGGDWCGDCQVLDIYFNRSPNAEILAQHYIVVPIDIGHYDKNVDLAEKYNVPLKAGVPALAVLDDRGRLLYSQKTGEFEDMRYMQAASVTDFLNRWKG